MAVRARSSVDIEFGGGKYRYDPSTGKFTNLTTNVEVDSFMHRQLFNDPTVRSKLMSSLSELNRSKLASGITPMPQPTSRIANLRNAVGDSARRAGDAIQNGWSAVRGGTKKPGNLVDGAKGKAKPLPDADAPKTKQDLVDGGAKDGDALDDAIKNGDELAKDPSIAKTLQKWGIRGGIGVCFLMLLYDTANPFEAVGKGAKDARDAVKGGAEILRGIINFIKNNGIVSLLSLCCCVLLIMLPMIMGGARSMAPPRRPMYGYY